MKSPRGAEKDREFENLLDAAERRCQLQKANEDDADSHISVCEERVSPAEPEKKAT